MTDQLFYWILNMSILGSAAALLTLLLRQIRRLPKFLVYLLWLIPLARLWLPAGLSNEFSLLNLIPRYATKTVTVYKAFPSIYFSITNSIQLASNYFPITYKTDLLKDLFNTAGTVWAIGAAASLLCCAFLYIITKSALRDARHIKDNIYISPKVLSPAVYGITRPKIILPENCPKENIDYIIAHEKVHIRRKDNLWRVIAVVTACLHWFNPLVWLCLKYFFTDMELACDAGVLKKLPADGKKEYAGTLLAFSHGKTYYASAFGGAKTKLRIENILSYKKATILSSLFFAAFFIAMALIICTNATGG